MGLFTSIADRIVGGMVKSGEMERIVSNSMADEFEKLSRKPEYAHCAERLRKMAERARNGSTR